MWAKLIFTVSLVPIPRRARHKGGPYIASFVLSNNLFLCTLHCFDCGLKKKRKFNSYMWPCGGEAYLVAFA